VTIPVREDMLTSDKEIGRFLQTLPQRAQMDLVNAFNADLEQANTGQMNLFADDIDIKTVSPAQDVGDIPKIVRLTHMRGRDNGGQFRIILDLEMHDPKGYWVTAMLDGTVQKLSSVIAHEIGTQDIARYSSEFGNYMNVWGVSDVRKIIRMESSYHMGAGRIQFSEMIQNIIVDKFRLHGKRFDDYEEAVEYCIADDWSRHLNGQHYMSLISGFTAGFAFRPDSLMFEGDWADQVIVQLATLFSEHNIFVLLLGNEMYASPARKYLTEKRI